MWYSHEICRAAYDFNRYSSTIDLALKESSSQPPIRTWSYALQPAPNARGRVIWNQTVARANPRRPRPARPPFSRYPTASRPKNQE